MKNSNNCKKHKGKKSGFSFIHNTYSKVSKLKVYLQSGKSVQARPFIILFEPFYRKSVFSHLLKTDCPSKTNNMSEQQTGFKPTLGLFDGTMIVAGSMIGSGIFIVSADITRNVGSAGWLIAVWLITGFMTLTAALSYGELSGMYPKSRGTICLPERSL